MAEELKSLFAIKKGGQVSFFALSKNGVRDGLKMLILGGIRTVLTLLLSGYSTLSGRSMGSERSLGSCSGGRIPNAGRDSRPARF